MRVRGDEGGGARGAEAGGVLGDGVGGGSRTLIATFLACKRVDLIRFAEERVWGTGGGKRLTMEGAT